MKSKLCTTLLIAAGLLAGAAQLSAAAAPRTIAISVSGTDLKYDVAAMTATPGEELKVVFTNKSPMPKIAFGHNWVLLAAGTDVVQFAAAATAAGAANEYIPPALKAQVLAATKLLGPNEVAEVTFKAPTTPGDYVYVCTFPQHNGTMRGILTVK